VDPALRELLRRGSVDDEVEALIRFADKAAPPPLGIRVVARFGNIASVRLRRGAIPRVRAHDSVASLKAPRFLGPEALIIEPGPLDRVATDTRRPNGLPSGAGVCIGILDWGLDVVREAFRRSDGSSRILALWDQRDRRSSRPNRYGYGTIYNRHHINAALRSPNPYVTLGYHPAEADPLGIGAHGTVCASIAAGGGSTEMPAGVAPEADIVFVHLTNRGTSGLASLGDSVGIFEGLDFIHRVAGRRPLVFSLSVGRHAGPHDGSGLSDLGIDSLLNSRSAIGLTQSAGNYGLRLCHSKGMLRPGSSSTFSFIVHARDRTDNELEVWHDCQECSVRLASPDGMVSDWTRVGGMSDLSRSGRPIARIYHRRSDPQNGSQFIDAFVFAGAPAGEWVVTLRDDRVAGRPEPYHAWIERDDGCPQCQSRFRPEDADPTCTLGSLACCRSAIVCGAYNAHDSSRPAAAFSSRGPTRGSRLLGRALPLARKPDCAAPGVAILAVRSQPAGDDAFDARVRRSGTSMSAPYVSGCIALLFQRASGHLWNEDIHDILLSTADAAGDVDRLGAGYVNIQRAIEMAARIGAHRESGGRRFVDLAAATMGEGLMTDQNRRWPPSEGFDACIAGGGVRPFTDPLLAQLVGDRAEDGVITADQLFRSLRRGAFVEGIEVLAGPGNALPSTLRAGDVIVRVGVGEPGRGHVAVIVDPELRSRVETAFAGLADENDGPGSYAQVVEAGAFRHTSNDGFARRILDGHGRVPYGQMIIRPRLSEVAADIFADSAPAVLPIAAVSMARTGSFFKDLAHLQRVPLEPPHPVTPLRAWDFHRRSAAATFNRLGGLIGALAGETGVDTAGVLAVWIVESGGRRHVPGRAIIRFENHVLFRTWGKNRPDQYDRYFRHGGRGGQPLRAWESHEFRDDAASAFRLLHDGKQETEYEALGIAERLAGQNVALQCISMGGPQIMGFHFRDIGYASPREMYDAFQRDERSHVLGFFDFLRVKPAPAPGDLIEHMRERRWREFGQVYNGDGAAYGPLIERNYHAAQGVLVTVPASEAESDPDPDDLASSEDYWAPVRPYGLDGRSIDRSEEAVDQQEPAIEALDLADVARKAAYELKSQFPTVRFLSGRRTRSQQARAMASHVVRDRKWIVKARYVFSRTKELQQWVDDHPEVTSTEEIARGLEDIMDTWTNEEMGLLSKHFLGKAFDVQPVTENATEIKAAMSSLPGATRLLEKEGDDVVWHVQF
jgi:N-acetylmuramidase/Subtilase family